MSISVGCVDGQLIGAKNTQDSTGESTSRAGSGNQVAEQRSEAVSESDMTASNELRELSDFLVKHGAIFGGEVEDCLKLESPPGGEEPFDMYKRLAVATKVTECVRSCGVVCEATGMLEILAAVSRKDNRKWAIHVVTARLYVNGYFIRTATLPPMDHWVKNAPNAGVAAQAISVRGHMREFVSELDSHIRKVRAAAEIDVFTDDFLKKFSRE